MTAGADLLPVTLLGFTVDDGTMRRVLQREPTMPVQTHTFAWAVLGALQSAACRTTVLSVPPVSPFPRYPQLVFRGGAVEQGAVNGNLIPYLNLPLLRHATRFLGGCWTALPALRRWRSSVLLVHGVHSPFLWRGVLARAATGTRIVTMLTDAPGVSLPGESAATAVLRRIDTLVVRAALRRYDGIVAVTADLAHDFAPGRQWMLMEGIVGEPSEHGPEIPDVPGVPDTPDGRFDIAYAGGLTREYGVDRLVGAVRSLPDPNVRLLLYGRGDLESWLHHQAAEDPRISVPQFVPRDVLHARLRAASVLVNPRPVAQDIARYGFPSKLVDYLATGVPVITTALPGIPEAYHCGMVLAGADTAAGLAGAISRVRALSPSDARALGARGRQLLHARCASTRQGLRLRRFFETLGARR